MAETLADRLNALTAKHGGAWTRTPRGDDSVAVHLILADGTAIAGTGTTTADAVTQLEQRVAKFADAMEG